LKKKKLKYEDIEKFRTKYCLDNPLFNLTQNVGCGEASVAMLFIIGIPAQLVGAGQAGVLLAFVFAIFTWFYTKHLEKEFEKAWRKHFKEKFEDNL